MDAPPWLRDPEERVEAVLDAQAAPRWRSPNAQRPQATWCLGFSRLGSSRRRSMRCHHSVADSLTTRRHSTGEPVRLRESSPRVERSDTLSRHPRTTYRPEGPAEDGGSDVGSRFLWRPDRAQSFCVSLSQGIVRVAPLLGCILPARWAAKPPWNLVINPKIRLPFGKTVCAALCAGLITATALAGTLYVWQDSPNPTPPYAS
jgi:hypothetical protein